MEIDISSPWWFLIGQHISHTTRREPLGLFAGWSLEPCRTRLVSVCRGRHVTRLPRPTTRSLCSSFRKISSLPGQLAAHAPAPTLAPASAVCRPSRHKCFCHALVSRSRKAAS
ncbi:hypothetical protein CGRA01v4_14816 [Colletotrichum graminicola]|nr:hypothetical protein CGRA01v4_14816 [Colletotrichum graminicola]